MNPQDEVIRMHDQTGFYGPSHARKTFVLCFDGTGNKFSGTDSDSNILKIFRMLDREDPHQLHYYQPGVGTYVQSRSYAHTSRLTRLNSWLQKARDSAIGSSFAEHVMGGYKFLMRYYSSGDDIYIFGFSRGAYIARFLAEMLDYVGLLSAGNEEMARFAWKAFQQWQQRGSSSSEEEGKKQQMFEYMNNFRETFSRPVRRIRFLGLFDTVNSVPAFENAWLKRSKFPYTARSSAIVIRHAVSIDERRAKFRQDLISETAVTSGGGGKYSGMRARQSQAKKHHHLLHGRHHHEDRLNASKKADTEARMASPAPQRYRRQSHARPSPSPAGSNRNRSRSPMALDRVVEGDGHSTRSDGTDISARRPPRISFRAAFDDDDDDDEDEARPQSIQEMWFPGCHADIGGGWPRDKKNGEEVLLSHPPLVWMVNEARKAGLQFDEDKMRRLNCFGDDAPEGTQAHDFADRRPTIEVEGPETPGGAPGEITMLSGDSTAFHETLHKGSTGGLIHDCLTFNNGLGVAAVLSWRLMEYLPFSRMDLQPDGSWKAIRWPLPKGEVRDIPSNAVIHNSAIRRMEANENYRPGNLIVGGGGRGVRIAPKEYGIGEWEVCRSEGDAVCQGYVRTQKPKPATNGAGGTAGSEKAQ